MARALFRMPPGHCCRLLFLQDVPTYDLLLSMDDARGLQGAQVNTPVRGMAIAPINRSVCGVGSRVVESVRPFSS